MHHYKRIGNFSTIFFIRSDVHMKFNWANLYELVLEECSLVVFLLHMYTRVEGAEKILTKFLKL